MTLNFRCSSKSCVLMWSLGVSLCPRATSRWPPARVPLKDDIIIGGMLSTEIEMQHQTKLFRKKETKERRLETCLLSKWCICSVSPTSTSEATGQSSFIEEASLHSHLDLNFQNAHISHLHHHCRQTVEEHLRKQVYSKQKKKRSIRASLQAY